MLMRYGIMTSKEVDAIIVCSDDEGGIVRSRVESGAVRVAGAIHDLQTGRVERLEPGAGAPALTARTGR